VFHDRKVMYANPWISVTESQVTRPDGNPGIYGYISYRNRAVAVVPLDDEGYTWLVGQYRPVIGCYSWELPEGGVPKDEDLLDGARRELLEETGLIAEHYELISRTYLSNSTSDEEAFVFLATGITQGEPDPEGTEQLRVVRVHLDDALHLADTGVLTDVFTVVALQTVERRMRTTGA
jgi:ADP-ribose pyrophosphatase